MNLMPLCGGGVIRLVEKQLLSAWGTCVSVCLEKGKNMKRIENKGFKVSLKY